MYEIHLATMYNMYYALCMDNKITLSVLLLRRHHDLFKDHGNDPVKKMLGRVLHDSTRRTLTAKEAERAIDELKKLRGRG